MQINANFAERVAVHAAELPWTASPMPGVDRRMLDRLGGEVARATSIVRYAPDSSFSPHVHTGGEEFFVLDGVFQDEHGDFPAGSYIRNPPQSRHTPGSAAGCTIFVKLWQFDPADRRHVHIDTHDGAYTPAGDRSGVDVLPLYQDDREVVRLERWQPGALLTLDAPDGLEILVLDGSFIEGGEAFKRMSWLRLPRQGTARALAGPEGTHVWIKEGHLAVPPEAPGVS